MIAEILGTFSQETLAHKITYQESKIELGIAKELYNSSGDTLSEMFSNMCLVASLNDRIKSPFIEFVLSSPVGEDLSDEKFLEVTKDYLSAMGYNESCFVIIKNDDKDNRHVHVLATTSDINGKWIDDSFSKRRSGLIMRELEKKHGLEPLEKGKSSHNRTLGESQYRQYFFDTALHKALRSHNMKGRIASMLKESDTFCMINPDMSKAYTNDEWKIMLGEQNYGDIMEVLSKGKFFNPLYKDELLAAMDRLYPECSNMKEFRDKLEKEGYYCRLVSDKGKSHYVYGIPERGFYLKDTSLPERYRFGKIAFFEGTQMSPDEQKHYLYNRIFSILSESSGYDDFKERLAANNIKVVEHVNSTGIYGLSFAMMDVEKPEMFKASDISRRLTYKSINDFFQGKEPGTYNSRSQRQEQQRAMDIAPVVSQYSSNRQEWERDLNYMLPAAAALNGVALESGKKERNREDEDFNKKKKKKRNRGLSI